MVLDRGVSSFVARRGRESLSRGGIHLQVQTGSTDTVPRGVSDEPEKLLIQYILLYQYLVEPNIGASLMHLPRCGCWLCYSNV